MNIKKCSEAELPLEISRLQEQKIEFEVILAHYRGFKENWDQD